MVGCCAEHNIGCLAREPSKGRWCSLLLYPTLILTIDFRTGYTYGGEGGRLLSIRETSIRAYDINMHSCIRRCTAMHSQTHPNQKNISQLADSHTGCVLEGHPLPPRETHLPASFRCYPPAREPICTMGIVGMCLCVWDGAMVDIRVTAPCRLHAACTMGPSRVAPSRGTQWLHHGATTCVFVIFIPTTHSLRGERGARRYIRLLCEAQHRY